MGAIAIGRIFSFAGLSRRARQDAGLASAGDADTDGMGRQVARVIAGRLLVEVETPTEVEEVQLPRKRPHAGVCVFPSLRGRPGVIRRVGKEFSWRGERYGAAVGTALATASPPRATR